MVGLAADGSRWGERIARARQLADASSPAADLLRFYAALAEYQRSLLQRCGGNTPDEGDPGWVIGALRDFVSWLPRVAPPHLRETAHAMRELTASDWRERLDEYRSQPGDAADRLGEAAGMKDGG